MSLSAKALATRNRILDAADELFYLHGYNATGLDKIIKAAGVTKGNFYYHFKSKEVLATASLDWHFEITAKEIQDKVLNKKTSPLNSLFALLEMMTRRQKKQHKDGYICGCYFGNFTLELSTASMPVRSRVKSIFNRYLQIIQSLLEQAQDADEIPHHIDPAGMSVVILSQLEGAILLDKANQTPGSVDTAIDFIRRYLGQA